MKKILVVSLLLNLAFAVLFFAQCEDGSKKERSRLEKEIQAADSCWKFFISQRESYRIPNSGSGQGVFSYIEKRKNDPFLSSNFDSLSFYKVRLDSLKRELEALP